MGKRVPMIVVMDRSYVNIAISENCVSTPVISDISKMSGFFQMVTFKNTAICVTEESYQLLFNTYRRCLGSEGIRFSSIPRISAHDIQADGFLTVLMPIWSKWGLEYFRQIVFQETSKLHYLIDLQKKWALEWGFNLNTGENVVDGAKAYSETIEVISDDTFGTYEKHLFIHDQRGKLLLEKIPRKGIEIYHFRNGEMRVV